MNTDYYDLRVDDQLAGFGGHGEPMFPGMEALDSTSTSLKRLLLDHYNISIASKHLKQLNAHLLEFELRQGHVEALNSPLLGTSKMYFLTKDIAVLFDIFDIEYDAFKKLVQSAHSVNPAFQVTSDPYNILTIWLVHLVAISGMTRKQKEDTQMLLLKLMHYKFFTSLVNYNFRYGADPAVMEYTIDNLSGKFDIKSAETPTWKLVIEARCQDVINPKSIHHKTLQTFSHDNAVLYVISDLQTRLRSRLKGVIQAYFKNHELGNKIGSFGLVNEIEGEKVLKDMVNTFDRMTEALTSSALNTTRFISREDIEITLKLNKNLRGDTFRAMLMKFSDIAVSQYSKKEQDKTQGEGSHKVLIGYRVLITHIIQKTYRAAILAGDTDMKSKVAILEKARNLYRSSRISDEDILVIKNSVSRFVDEYSDSNRSSTNASLKLSFLTYIVLLSFKYM